MKGLVSFTLFGAQEMYLQGAIENAHDWLTSDLDVDAIFYVGKSVPDRTITALHQYGATIVFCDGPEDQTATFWRYEALNLDYDYILFRDVDSRVNDRELYAIREWLTERYDFHVIRDHPYHGVPILAGLFGVKRGMLGMIAERLPSRVPSDFYKVVVRACNHLTMNFESNDFYQVDQWWLRLNVHSILPNKIMAHDEFFGFERKRYKFALPERLDDNSFIGEGFTELNQPRFPQHRDCFKTWPRRSLVR